MKHRFRVQHIMLFCVAVMLSSCSSLNPFANSVLSVTSEPAGADIIFVRAGSLSQTIGKTPMNIEPSQLPELYQDNIQLVLKHEGFFTENVLIPKTNTTTETKIFVKMKATFGQQDVALNDISRSIAEVTNLIQKKSYPEAESKLRIVSEKYPNVAVIWDLLGNIYYLQKNSVKALESYRKSMELNPNNPETARLIEKLGGITGQQRGAM